MAALGSAAMSSERRRWWATFTVVVIVGVTWALSVPPAGGPDEHAHLVKAAAVAGGDLSTAVTWQEAWLGEMPTTSVRVPEGYHYSAMWEQVGCWTGQWYQQARCAPPLAERSGPTVTTDTYVGPYQPLYYAVVGLPTRFWPPSRGVYAARILSVAVGAALVASALASARRLGGWATTGTLLALPVAVVYLASTVNPQGPEILAALALWTTGLLVFGRSAPTRREVVRLTVAAVVTTSARPTGPALTGLIIVMLVLAAADADRFRALWRRRSARAAAALVAVAFVINLAHVIATRALSSVMKTPRPDGLTDELLQRVVDGLPTLVSDQVGLISWHGIITLHLPRPLELAWLGVIGTLVIGALIAGSARTRLVLLAVVAGWAVMPLAALVSQPEVSWQGRYGLPIGVGIPVLAGWMVDRHQPLRRWAAPAIAGYSLLNAVCLLVSHQALMSRNLHGQPSRVFAPRDNSLWNGPFTPDALFAAALIASGAVAALGLLAALAVWRSGAPGPPARPVPPDPDGAEHPVHEVATAGT
jgi:hypothetical protein